jgi:DnaD/phage-associated family protein
LSWGCGKKEAIIPQQKDFELVGVYECDIKEELNHLVNCKVIFMEDNLYSFNKNYDQWRITISKKYTPERLCELLSLNLSELCKTQSQNSADFAKDKVQTLQKTKFATSEIALPKESIKEIYNNNNYIDNNNKNITAVTDPEKPEITPGDICSLYENEIGLLTPLMRKNIEESLDTFPADWVADAIKTASESNVKKWSYVAKVLNNWAESGKGEPIKRNKSSPPDDPKRFTSGEYGRFVQH